MIINEGYVICSNDYKDSLLKEKKNGFVNYIYLTYDEFLEKLTFKVDSKALLYLVEKYKFSYSLAKEYINKLKWINNKSYNNPKLDSMVSVYNALKMKGYIIENKLFTIRLRQFPVTFVYPSYSKEYFLLKSIVEQYTKVYEIGLKCCNVLPLVYEFDTINNEVLFVLNKITDLLKDGVSLNNIYIAGVSEDYIYLFKRLARTYNVTIEFPKVKNILSSDYIKKFLILCKEYDSFNDILDVLDKNNDLYGVILNTIDRYGLSGCPVDHLDFFNYIFSNLSYPNKRFNEAIKFVNDSFRLKKNEYLFYVGFNLGEAPKICKESGYLLDKDLEVLGLSTSVDLNNASKKDIINFISQENVIITYKLSNGTDSCLPSQIIKELGVNVCHQVVDYGYSKIEDDLRLSSHYDMFLKYNELHDELNRYGIGGILYQSFDNKYKKIDKKLLDDRFSKKKLSLSYSNVKPYFMCPFGYFADRILGLNEFKPQMAARLGTFSHAVLEDSYGSDFDFELSVEKNMNEFAVDGKDRFFFERMKEILLPLINYNKEHEALSKLDVINREAEIIVDNGDYEFKGFIDKLMYTIIDDEVYAAIIDYKTGKDVISLDNIEDGFHLQLPSYMYLLSRYDKFIGKNINIIGIYLQKVNLVIFDGKKDYYTQLEKSFYLQGYSVKDISLIEMLDPNFSCSSYIKSMSLTKDGFNGYAKLYKKEDQEYMINLVGNLLDKASLGIHNGDFEIAPKRIDGKNESCMFCKYKDLCFLEDKDIIDLPKKSFKERD